MPVQREGEKDFLSVQQDDVSRMTSAANNAMFELLGDDAESINKNKKIVRWDNKRKRYVHGTVGELKDNKHIRNESGKLIRSKSQGKRGELYEKWRKTHKMSEQEIGGETEEKSVRRRSGEKKEKARDKSKHILMWWRRTLTTAVRSEVKSREQIVKDLKQKEKNKIKQMSKKDRENYLKKKGLWRERNQPSRPRR